MQLGIRFQLGRICAVDEYTKRCHTLPIMTTVNDQRDLTALVIADQNEFLF